MTKLILTDCDGVLLDWMFGFDRWMKSHGYTKHSEKAYQIEECYNITPEEASRLIKMFNETHYVTNLSPLRDAVRVVRRLHEDFGTVLHVITSIASDALPSRRKNLESIFGSSVFYKIEAEHNKQRILEQYRGSNLLWLEDHIGNYRIGEALGLDARLMTHYWNVKEKNVKRIDCWQPLIGQKESSWSSDNETDRWPW